MGTNVAEVSANQRETSLQIIGLFLKLGRSIFGSSIARSGYFREEFELRRRWIDEDPYADMVGLCQFLPGSSSSQVAFAIGLKRSGYLGALAAWTGFTMPLALLLVALAYGAANFSGPVGNGLIHALKPTAVAIVAQAVFGMSRSLCPDRERASIALVAALIVLFGASSAAQFGAIALGGIAGLRWCRHGSNPVDTELGLGVSRRAGGFAPIAFAFLLVGLLALRGAIGWSSIALFDAFYRSGALVFGGGLVVLPLLRDVFVVPGWRNVSRRLRHGPGVAGTAVQLRHLSRGDHRTRAVRIGGRGARPRLHIPSGHAGPDRRAADLAFGSQL